MRKSVQILGVVAAVTSALGLLGASSDAAERGGRTFTLAMSGAEEFNAAGAPINPHGDADHGTISLTFNPGRGEVCWSVSELTLTSGDALPHVAHIHEAPAGIAGPVVIDLFGGASAQPAPTAYPTDTSCVSAERSVTLAIFRDPSAYYVNLHNAQHPAGAVRAQLG